MALQSPIRIEILVFKNFSFKYWRPGNCFVFNSAQNNKTFDHILVKFFFGVYLSNQLKNGKRKRSGKKSLRFGIIDGTAVAYLNLDSCI